jgi:antitoxin component YwqK of YwqJK toxin-antitoxin module
MGPGRQAHLVEGNGIMRSYFASGSRSWRSAPYTNGLKDGPSTEFHPAGNPKAKGAYRARQKHGPWSYWYSNNKLEKKDAFVNGKLDGHYELWFRSGQINVEGWHKAGLKGQRVDLVHHCSARRIRKALSKQDYAKAFGSIGTPMAS